MIFIYLQSKRGVFLFGARLNRDDGGLLPEAYLQLVRKKGHLISEHKKDLLLQRLDHP